ncbi:MAG: ABC transporter ATP-binding protein, partial [Polyangiaceae bacterium]|nr:ABC transporter ATP-binding protein [Polyangiaceae bacterium]
LAKLLLEPRNLLFLDEPTNHLDIPAAEVLEEALVNFEGTTVFVSHDRRFLENVSTRVLAFRDGAIDDFSGSYRELVERDRRGPVVGGDAEEWPEAAQVEEKALEGSGERNARRASFEANKAAARALQRKQRRLQELETRIAEGEAELSELRSKLARASGDAWEELASLAHQEQVLQTKVEFMMNEWFALGDDLANGGGEQF